MSKIVVAAAVAQDHGHGRPPPRRAGTLRISLLPSPHKLSFPPDHSHGTAAANGCPEPGTTAVNGCLKELAMTVFRLPVFFKQRDSLFYPAWAFALPIWVLCIPIFVVESALWIIFTYYTIGFAPSPVRFFKQLLAFIGVHQMALSLFRFIAVVGRTQVVANTFGTFALLLVFVLAGFVVAKGK
ncbi:pleiotropic drug resistance protein 2-like [Salvia miltiorrhiza]|uniref:pleiotropic drug resistance protein 2-like n=1 Tax=Salvia miltiorrhiza TaxID=226208 RepID=UPI0025AD7A59|nr:pleiotropic drug resistance protein 2-like [Salvia miltiorrhiza]